MQEISKLIITAHCAARMRQRGYRSADVETVESLGTPSRDGIVLRKKDIEPELEQLSMELKMIRQRRIAAQNLVSDDAASAECDIIRRIERARRLVGTFVPLEASHAVSMNWTFGFERIVDLRLKAVTAAKGELSRAETDLFALQEQRRQSTNGDRQKRDELRRGLDQRDVSIAQLTPQLAKEAEVHQKNLEGIREACRIIRDRCMVPRSQAEDLRYATEVNQLSAALARLRAERTQLQSQVDEFVSKDAASAALISKNVSAAQISVNEARQALRSAADGNQIYRLAASWYRVSTSDITAEQFATARWVFATFSAIAVAFAGSIAALVYYARDRLPGSSSLFGKLMTKVARARRAYYARKRRPIVRETVREVLSPERVVYRDGKEPPVVVEKEVLRFIDQIVLIPRWGIKAPIHVNPLVRRQRGRGIGATRDNSTNAPSNVMSLSKKVS